MFTGWVFRLSADHRRHVELRQLKPAVAVPGSASLRYTPPARDRLTHVGNLAIELVLSARLRITENPERYRHV